MAKTIKRGAVRGAKEAMEIQEAIRLLISARHHCFVRGVLHGEAGFREAFRDLNRLYVNLRRETESQSVAPSVESLARRAGRPRKYRSDIARRTAERAQNRERQRAFRRNRENQPGVTENTPASLTF